jgi:hypothetical protein
VVVDEFSTGCFDDSASVGGGVVRLAFAQSDSLGHSGDNLNIKSRGLLLTHVELWMRLEPDQSCKWILTLIQ